jgi:hypothetical protein
MNRIIQKQQDDSESSWDPMSANVRMPQVPQRTPRTAPDATRDMARDFDPLSSCVSSRRSHETPQEAGKGPKAS